MITRIKSNSCATFKESLFILVLLWKTTKSSPNEHIAEKKQQCQPAVPHPYSTKRERVGGERGAPLWTTDHMIPRPWDPLAWPPQTMATWPPCTMYHLTPYDPTPQDHGPPDPTPRRRIIWFLNKMTDRMTCVVGKKSAILMHPASINGSSSSLSFSISYPEF